jgi:hypothetical protein
MRDKEDEPGRVPAALLISALSGFAYACVYAYEIAYCDFFGVPRSFVIVSISNIILIATIGLVVGTYLYPFTILIPALEDGSRTRFVESAMGALMLAIPVVVWLTPPASLGFKIAVTGMCVLFAIHFWFGILNPLLRVLRFPIPIPKRVLFEEFHLRYRHVVMTCSLVLITVIILCYAAGLAVASSRSVWAITLEAKPKVVLAHFGDDIITAAFDPKTALVAEEFTVYEIGKDAPPFRIQELGPLRSATALPTVPPSAK